VMKVVFPGFIFICYFIKNLNTIIDGSFFIVIIFSKPKINHFHAFPDPSMSKPPYSMTKWGFGLVKAVFEVVDVFSNEEYFADKN